MRSIVGCLLLFTACVGDAPAVAVPDAGIAMGEEGGACFSDGKCKAGLVCVIPNKCVRPDAGPEDASTDVADAGTTDAPMNVDAGCTTTITNTVSYWPCDSLADKFGMNNLSWSMPKYVPAEVGNGLDLGLTSYPYVSPVNLGALTDFTIEFWIKPKLTQTLQRVISMEDSTNGTVWSVDLPATNSGLAFTVAGATVLIPKGLPDTKFTHVAFVFFQAHLVGFQDGS